MEMLGSMLLPFLVFGAITFMLGFSMGVTKAERRNKFYRRIWGL
jgi:hypothetical protein